jgi:hypothetical protein
MGATREDESTGFEGDVFGTTKINHRNNVYDCDFGVAARSADGEDRSLFQYITVLGVMYTLTFE